MNEKKKKNISYLSCTWEFPFKKLLSEVLEKSYEGNTI
jgi:hypothetical protein